MSHVAELTNSATVAPPAGSVEVTHQDYCRGTIGDSSSSPTRRFVSSQSAVTPILSEDSATNHYKHNNNRTATMAKRLGNMLTPRKSRRISGSRRRDGSPDGSIPGDSNASVSVVSDNATLHSFEGQQSVAITVDSQVTVKMSNRHEKTKDNDIPKPPITSITGKGSPSMTNSKKSTGWLSLKRLVGGKPPVAQPATPPSKGGATKQSSWRARAHSKSYDAGTTRTVVSSPEARDRTESADGILRDRTRTSSESMAHLDLAIRGRLDGMDVLFLGPAQRVSLPSSSEAMEKSPVKGLKKGEAGNPHADIDPSTLSFTGMPTTYTAAEMVSDMISTSAGKEHPELIFEGYIPGGGDRWCVKLEDPSPRRETTIAVKTDNSEWVGTFKTNYTTTTSEVDDESTVETADVTADDGSPTLPMQKLWDHLWGDDHPPPIPSHMQTGGSFDEGNKEDIVQLAAACSVPIDIDEDSFIIDHPEHLRSVHDLAMVPLQRRRFDDALTILDKLMKGLQAPSNSRFEHLVGVTYHNIGLIHMSQGNFGDALENFKRAVVVRTQCLPANHPDIAVSLVREGIAYLALESYDDSVNSFTIALRLTPAENATRAKILNNLGVAHYLRNDLTSALEAFTGALEIQRQWLDGPVRREPIVYDASVSLSNMGKVYIDMKDYELAFYVLEEACLLQSTTFRKDHDIVLATLGSMALAQTKNKNYKKAAQIYSSILRSQEAKYGIESQEAAETAGMLGFVHIKEVDFEDALKHLRRVESWQNGNLPTSHPAIRMTKDTILAIEKCMQGTASVWI